MLAKEITYEDYNGETRTETFYFHLNKSEILKMDFEAEGGIIRYLQKLVRDKKPAKLLQFFEDFIRKSYGVKSEDGRKFIKNDEVFSEFVQTGAYDALFMELLSGEGPMTEFINGVMPKAD